MAGMQHSGDRQDNEQRGPQKSSPSGGRAGGGHPEGAQGSAPGRRAEERAGLKVHRLLFDLVEGAEDKRRGEWQNPAHATPDPALGIQASKPVGRR